jgi:hypothetical protein
MKLLIRESSGAETTQVSELQKALGCSLGNLTMLSKLHWTFSIKWENNFECQNKKDVAYFMVLCWHLLGLPSRLPAGRSGVHIQVGARDFLFSKTVQTDFETHPASYSMSTHVLSWR